MSLLAVALLLASAVKGHDNGLAITPQMGWNTWNTFACEINETILETAADKLVDLGLDKYGYHYIVMDDCWSLKKRDSSGRLQPDPAKFPKGIAALADYIHSKGLGFGMYSDAGKYTCGGFPGSLGHETVDAQTFADWGVDYLKYDNCYNEGQSGTAKLSYDRYKVMSDALNATGRPILYSMCNWGEDGTWNWATTIANSFRISGDITTQFDRPDDRCPCESYDCPLPGFHCSVMNIVNKAAPLGQKAGIGRWNDLDMLEVGREGLTYEEQRLHFSIWAAVKSPLIMGHDLLSTDERTLEMLTNREILDMNQGQWEVAFRSYRREQRGGGDYQLWVQSSSNASAPGNIVTVLNSTKKNATVEIEFDDIWLDDFEKRKGSYKIRDLWAHKDIGTARGSIKAAVSSHGVRVFKLMPVSGH